MCGWVGVGKEVESIMAEVFAVQGFEQLTKGRTPAPLAWTEFQPFWLYSITISHAMIVSSALLNLENFILTSFSTPAVEISFTPY